MPRARAQLRTTNAPPKEAIGEAVENFHPPQQFLHLGNGDVPNDADMRVAGFDYVGLCQRFQRPAIPGGSKHGRKRIAVTLHRT